MLVIFFNYMLPRPSIVVEHRRRASFLSEESVEKLKPRSSQVSLALTSSISYRQNSKTKVKSLFKIRHRAHILVRRKTISQNQK